MDEVVIEIRTRTDRPGKEPICTAEYIVLPPSALWQVNLDDDRGLHRIASDLVGRARNCVTYGKSADELTPWEQENWDDIDGGRVGGDGVPERVS